MDTTPHNFEPTDDALLTAYALGEVEGADLAAAERLIAADPDAASTISDIRQTAAWLADGLKGEPDVGLTAIHVASIERQLARYAESDAPQPEALPLRRNWGLWGSVAASTLIVATVMASVLPRVFQDAHGPHGSGGGGGNSAAEPAISPTASPSGSGGLIMSSAPSGQIGKLTGAGGDSLASDWPILKTSAGGLPWPTIISRQTGFAEPAFVVPGDFPLAIIPPTPIQSPGKGSLAAIESSLEVGRLPSPQSVRVDELINAVTYVIPDGMTNLSLARPAEGHGDEPAGQKTPSPVSALVETAVCPWNSGHLLVRVTVRTSGMRGTAPGSVDPESIVPFSPEIVPLVRDLRLVAEVNPAAAAGYRLLGYENGPRSWGEWSGRDDDVVVPAGTAFTALIEVVPTGQELPESSKPAEPRRYTERRRMVVTATELLTVSVEYRQGPAAELVRLDLPVSVEATGIESTTPDFRAAAGAAALGLSLRNVDPANDPLLDTSIKLLADVTATAPAEDRQKLLDMARKVKARATDNTGI